MAARKSQFALLGLMLVVVGVSGSILEGRLLQTTCCSQCPEARFVHDEYSADMAKSDFLYGLQKGYPDNFYTNILSKLPIDFTTEMLASLGEIKFRSNLGLYKGSTPPSQSDGRYFAQLGNMTIQVLFESFIASLETDISGLSSQQRAIRIGFLKLIRENYNRMMVAAQKSRYVYYGNQKYVAEEVAKNVAVSFLSMFATQSTLAEQEMITACFEKANQEYQELISAGEVFYQLTEFPINWDYCPRTPKTPFTEQEIASNPLLKDFLTKPVEGGFSQCPRSLDLRAMIVGEERTPSSQKFGPSTDQVWKSGQVNPWMVWLIKKPLAAAALTAPVYLSQFRQVPLSLSKIDTQVFHETYNGEGAKSGGYKAIAKIFSYFVGPLIMERNPRVLDRLRLSCPGTCTPC